METPAPENSSTKLGLSQFSFTFLIELRNVNDKSRLEQIILKQHGLTGKNIPESQIRSILEGESGRVLLLLDGYDEYREGTNADIDDAIENSIGECFVILTSRDGYIPKDILDNMDGEVEITGLSHKNIRKCAAKYLESEERANDLIEKCKEINIYDLLHIPIILLMVVVLYHKTEELPTSQTEIVKSIIFMCMDRSAMKHFNKKAKDIEGLEEMLEKLGELSLNALLSDKQQLLLSKVRILNEHLFITFTCLNIIVT